MIGGAVEVCEVDIAIMQNNEPVVALPVQAKDCRECYFLQEHHS